MATAEYPVTTTYSTVFQQAQNQPAVGLLNPGTTVIYLDTTPQLSTTQGMPLNPNATYKWAAGTPLYVIAPAAGGICRVLWDQDVQYYDPASLAAAINLVGVPAIDMPATILSQTQTVATGIVPTASVFVDVSRYQSLFIRLADNGVNNNVTTRDYTFTWYSSSAATGVILAIDTVQMATYGGVAYIQRPVKGAFLVITATAAATVTPCVLTWTVVGSLRTVLPRTMLKSAKNNVTGNLVTGTDVNKGFWIYSANIGAGATQLEYPDLVTGLVTVNLRTTSSPSNVLAVDFNTWAGQSYWSQPMTVGAASSFSFPDFLMPPQPLNLEINNFGAGTYDIQISAVSQLT